MSTMWSELALNFVSCVIPFYKVFITLHRVQLMIYVLMWDNSVTNITSSRITFWFKMLMDFFWIQGTCGLRYAALNIFHIVIEKQWHSPVVKYKVVC